MKNTSPLTSPLGRATLAAMRADRCYLVDKTAYLERLTGESRFGFLSRPRRFGKSLLLDTMRELFEGLPIHDRWNWHERYPAVRLSFGAGRFSRAGHLQSNVIAQLRRLEARHAVSAAYGRDDITAPDRFGNILYHIHESMGRQVAVLVDEYDKPILDAVGGRSWLRTIGTAWRGCTE